jgi:hypothetical protein
MVENALMETCIGIVGPIPIPIPIPMSNGELSKKN